MAQLIIDAKLRDTLKPELAQLNRSLETFAGETDGFLGNLLSYVLAGSGKRVRPALVMLGARLGSHNPVHVHAVAQAVELVHIATLVHDDVIDNALLRRARKTVAAEFGVDAAVLLGDHIYTYAFEKVAELNNPLLLGILARSTAVMCHGEIDQLKKRFQFNLNEAEYFSFIQKKTASLFGTSARAGTILAGQSVAIQTALEEFGNFLGMAFQITDDLLDLTGDESVVGKTLRTDLMNGKMTLPLIHYRNLFSSQSEIQGLIESVSGPNGQMAGLVSRMQEAGSIGYAEQVARNYVEQALSRLSLLPAGTARDCLTSLAEMLIDRRS